MEAGMRRVEALVDEVRLLPVNKLKDEMKELQVRRSCGAGRTVLLGLTTIRVHRTDKRGSRIC